MPVVPTLHINDTIRTRLQNLNINSGIERIADRWTAVDNHGFLFVDRYRILTAATRNGMIALIRKKLSPVLILGEEMLPEQERSGKAVSAFVPENAILQHMTLDRRYVVGIALNLPTHQTEVVSPSHREYVHFMFNEPIEVPFYPRNGTDWYSNRLRQKKYFTFINNCLLGANSIIEEIIRLDTIRIGLVRDVLGQGGNVAVS